jgi:hypothetical protein
MSDKKRWPLAVAEKVAIELRDSLGTTCERIAISGSMPVEKRSNQGRNRHAHDTGMGTGKIRQRAQMRKMRTYGTSCEADKRSYHSDFQGRLKSNCKYPTALHPVQFKEGQ